MSTITSETKPATLAPIFENIPAELRRCPSWVGWQWVGEWDERRQATRWTKPPRCVNGAGGYASSIDPSTWGSFAQAAEACDRGEMDGPGLVLIGHYVGIDLDDARDPDTGELHPDATRVIAAINSYAEVSPSGRGVRILARGALPAGWRNARTWAVPIEMYDRTSPRFVTLTGHHLPGTPTTIEERTAELAALHAEVAAAVGKSASAGSNGAGRHPHSDTGTDEDDALLERARAARNGDKFRRLFDDGVSDGEDHSAADLGLCGMLAFWTGRDPAAMDRLFRRSAMMRNKWTERHAADGRTYGELTIAKAIEACAETYSPGIGTATASDPTAPASAPAAPWPELDPAALYGLAGRTVETIAPHSEADPAAILLHMLVTVGNLIGPGPHVLVERDPHPARLYVVMAGRSSKGRKGTGASTVRAIARGIDPEWAVASGLSTGEGLIYHVRDRVERQSEDGEIEIVDEGVIDKRLMVLESEFASVLARMGREGNTLSAVLRDAWDHGDLRVLTKNNPVKASGAHVSVIGHITMEELARLFTDVSMANGLGNRILFACVRRAQLLPDGGGADPAALARITEELRGVVWAARGIGRMTRDPEAAAVWRAVYADLSRERDGLVGALLGRAEAQTLRLSVLYAALDRSPVIRLPHLQAALAVWQFCEASVLHLFAGRLGHPIADAILDALRRAGRMTRTQIRDLFGRHKAADQIEEALAMLERAKLAQRAKRPTGGRAEEVWEAA